MLFGFNQSHCRELRMENGFVRVNTPVGDDHIKHHVCTALGALIIDIEIDGHFTLTIQVTLTESHFDERRQIKSFSIFHHGWRKFYILTFVCERETSLC